MPWFGDQTLDNVGASVYYNGNYYLCASYDAPDSNGIADSISVRTNTIGRDANFQCAIYEYDDYSSDYAGNLIATTETKEILGTQDNTIITFNFSEPKPELVNGTNYYLAIRATESPLNSTIVATNDITARGIYKLDSSPLTFDDPLENDNKSTITHYIYCTYTESAEEEPTLLLAGSGKLNFSSGEGKIKFS